MHHLSSKYLKEVFSPMEVINIVRQGIIHYAEGSYNVPDRMHIKRGRSTNLIMPAFGEKYYCTKIVSVDPHNHIKKRPVISGIVVLNDSDSGEVLITMDAPMITALRTAAVGSIGLDMICGDVNKLGIIGLGVQGFWQSIFAISMREMTEIYCYTRNKEKFISYQDELNKWHPNVNIKWCPTAEMVVQHAQVIITCTTSSDPVFDTNGLDLQSKRFISVGSFSKHMQELPKDVYQNADALIIDSEAAKTEVGDVMNAMSNDWVDHSNIHALSDVLSGKESIAEYRNIVFKSVGMAAFDLALAVAVYEKYK